MSWQQGGVIFVNKDEDRSPFFKYEDLLDVKSLRLYIGDRKLKNFTDKVDNYRTTLSYGYIKGSTAANRCSKFEEELEGIVNQYPDCSEEYIECAIQALTKCKEFLSNLSNTRHLWGPDGEDLLVKYGIN